MSRPSAVVDAETTEGVLPPGQWFSESTSRRRLSLYRALGNPTGVDARERELLTGMGNCFEACGEDFAHTVQMVSSSRHRSADDVVETLRAMAVRYGSDPEYQALRRRVPSSFPF
jgi:hypothetical protein